MAAARYLRELLLRPGRYRQLWESRAERTRPGAINHLAVAEVLAHHLWNSPRAAGSSDVLPHQLKDTVGRALSGRLLSRSTLALFVAAFGFTTQEEDRLWRLWRGAARITVLAGPRAMQSRTVAEVKGALGPRRHQTVSLHDHAYIGADRQLTRTRTMQVVEAIVDGLDSIPYLYDTNVVTLELGQGCAGPPGPFRAIGDLVYVTDIPLHPYARPGRDAHPGVLDVLPLPGRPGRPGRAGIPPGGDGHPGELRHADRVSPQSAAHRGLVGGLGRDGRTGAGPGAGQPGQPALGAPLPAVAGTVGGRLPLVLGATAWLTSTG